MLADFPKPQETDQGNSASRRVSATQRGVRTYFLLFALLVLAAGIAYGAWHVNANYDRALDTARNNLLILSRALQNEFRAMLGDGLGAAGAAHRHIFGHAEASRGLEEALLEEDLAGGKYLHGLFIATEDSFLAVIRDHETLRLKSSPSWAQCPPDVASCALPVVTLDGSQYMPIVARVTEPQYQTHVVGALYDIDELAQLYQRLSLRKATYTLTTTDGIVLSSIDTDGTRRVEPASIARLRSFPRVASASATEPRILEGFSTITHEPVVASVIRVSAEFPLLISVGVPRDEILVPWRRSTWTIIATTTAVTLLLLVGIALLYQFYRRAIQREAQILKLVETSQAAIMVIEDGRVRYANDATSRIFRVPPDTSIIGMTPWEFSPATQPSGESSEVAGRRLFNSAQDDSQNSSWIHVRLDTGEPFEAEVSLSSIMFGDHEYRLAIVHDVSGMVRAQRELRVLNETLENRVSERTAELADANDELASANQKLATANAELEEFTASASHDLRSPLGTISKQCSLIEQSLGDATQRPEVARRFDKVHTAVRRAADVIDGLLSLARISRQDLTRAPVSLSKLAADIVDELRESEPTRSCHFSCDPDIMVDADARLMKSLLSNLLSNAWKYSSGRNPARISFAADATHGEVVLQVKDNGAGFDMQYAGRLFQAFTRLHGADTFAGTGIGLATVGRIVKRYGGRIWAEASENQGATFYFTLPRALPRLTSQTQPRYAPAQRH